MAKAAVQLSKVGKVNLLENKPHDSQKNMKMVRLNSSYCLNDVFCPFTT